MTGSALIFALRIPPGSTTLVVTVKGELDLTNARELRRAMAPASDVRRVVVDLTNLDYLDSSGLNALVVAKKDLDELAIPISVVATPGGNVGRLFNLARIGEMLTLVDSLEEALGEPPGSGAD